MPLANPATNYPWGKWSLQFEDTSIGYTACDAFSIGSQMYFCGVDNDKVDVVSVGDDGVMAVIATVPGGGRRVQQFVIGGVQFLAVAGNSLQRVVVYSFAAPNLITVVAETPTSGSPTPFDLDYFESGGNHYIVFADVASGRDRARVYQLDPTLNTLSFVQDVAFAGRATVSRVFLHNGNIYLSVGTILGGGGWNIYEWDANSQSFSLSASPGGLTSGFHVYADSSGGTTIERVLSNLVTERYSFDGLTVSLSATINGWSTPGRDIIEVNGINYVLGPSNSAVPLIMSTEGSTSLTPWPDGTVTNVPSFGKAFAHRGEPWFIATSASTTYLAKAIVKAPVITSTTLSGGGPIVGTASADGDYDDLTFQTGRYVSVHRSDSDAQLGTDAIIETDGSWSVSDHGLTINTSVYAVEHEPDIPNGAIANSSDNSNTASLVITAPDVTVTSLIQSQGLYADLGTGAASHTLEGAYNVGTPPVNLEWSFNGSAYTAFSSPLSGGSYSEPIQIPIGKGTLSVRYTDNTPKIASVTDVTSGIAIWVGGESNADGRSASVVSSLGSQIKRSENRNVWTALSDNSVWPLVGAGLLQSESIPTSVVNGAAGGSSFYHINGWGAAAGRFGATGANLNDAKTLFQTSKLTDVHAIVFWIGLNDTANAASPGTTISQYQTELELILAEIRLAVSANAIIVLGVVGENTGNSPSSDDQLDVMRQAIRGAANADGNAISIELWDIDKTIDQVHFQTDQEVAAVAGRFEHAIRVSLGLSPNGDSPEVTAAVATGANSFRVSYDGNLRAGLVHDLTAYALSSGSVTAITDGPNANQLDFSSDSPVAGVTLSFAQGGSIGGNAIAGKVVAGRTVSGGTAFQPVTPFESLAVGSFVSIDPGTILIGTNVSGIDGTYIPAPAASVLDGTVFGPSGSITGSLTPGSVSASDLRAGIEQEFGDTGTLAVPTPGEVLEGVAVDDGVGTLMLGGGMIMVPSDDAQVIVSAVIAGIEREDGKLVGVATELSKVERSENPVEAGGIVAKRLHDTAGNITETIRESTV